MISSEEFLASLSPVAHKLMTIYQFSESKPLRLNITENKEKPCFMVTDNTDCYPVFINPEALGPKAELCYMHQFLHCVQMDSGFPFLKEKDKTDEESAQLAAAINSLVLDMFVLNVLKDNGYPKDLPALNKQYTELYCQLRYMNENQTDISSFDKKYFEYIYASQIAAIYLNLDTKKARGLQKLAAPVSNDIKRYAGIFINTIKAYAFNTHNGCRYILNNLLDDLKLKDILYLEYNNKEEDKQIDDESKKSAEK